MKLQKYKLFTKVVSMSEYQILKHRSQLGIQAVCEAQN